MKREKFPAGLARGLGLKVETPSDRGKYVELTCLEAHSKMRERMRKLLENRGKTLTILENSQTTLGSGK